MTQQLKYVRYAINYVKHVSIQQIIVFNVNILCWMAHVSDVRIIIRHYRVNNVYRFAVMEWYIIR